MQKPGKKLWMGRGCELKDKILVCTEKMKRDKKKKANK